jgi:tetratricopeptide (TPR) repeat protein
VFDQVKDPNELDRESREDFRGLILYVGATALAMGHYTKALDILLWLKRLSDRNLNYDELHLLGSAYLWSADEQKDQADRRRHLALAVPLLKEAIEKNPYGVVATYNLGWALLSLERYEDGIEMMEKSIRLQKYYAPWAKWNIACGLKKLGKEDEALKKLEEIPPGPWWRRIQDDDWFKDPQQTVFMDEFQALCQRKINEFIAQTNAPLKPH